MTKEKALILSTICVALEKEYFKSESKFEIPKTLFYAISKNISKLKGVVNEKKELDETVSKDFKKEVDFDEEKAKDEKYLEEVNVEYRAYLVTDVVKEQYDIFYKEEYTGEIHKVKAEMLDEAILPSDFREILEETIIE